MITDGGNKMIERRRKERGGEVKGGKMRRRKMGRGAGCCNLSHAKRKMI